MMVSKKLIAAIIAAVVVAAVSASLAYTAPVLVEPPAKPADVTRYEELNERIQANLGNVDASVSSPIKIWGSLLSEYCDFFEDQRQRDIAYCTSTEMHDSDGAFLGNVHIVGGEDPTFVIGVIQVDPAMSRLDSVKAVFDTLVDMLVCECWEEQAPDDLPTLAHWVDAHADFHESGTRPHSTSTAVLDDRTIEIQLDTNEQGYLWHIIIEPKGLLSWQNG